MESNKIHHLNINTCDAYGQKKVWGKHSTYSGNLWNSSYYRHVMCETLEILVVLYCFVRIIIFPLKNVDFTLVYISFQSNLIRYAPLICLISTPMSLSCSAQMNWKHHLLIYCSEACLQPNEVTKIISKWVLLTWKINCYFDCVIHVSLQSFRINHDQLSRVNF